MLNTEVIKKIEDLVYAKPRSIQEISSSIGKNWRTADRYVEEIEKNFGTISTRVFRGGTRGALKIVYWSSVDKVSHSIFQERLEKQILAARVKEEFSPFDIYQYIDEKKKEAIVKDNEVDNMPEFRNILLSAQKQLLLFSGNLSFINIKNKRADFIDVFNELAKKRVNVKVLCRVDIVGKENVERMLSLNLRHGKDYIEIHHAEHPLRAAIVDGKLIRMKEVKQPSGKKKELEKALFIYYTMKDKEWAEWLSKIFWKIFSSSLDANKRLEELNRIRL
ncbi:MAG: hypothetical protein Q8Q31_03340 [Nanoarchaeota archaeon]|nr:hypothetical protein [Nanoarchaeota archaeon]